MLCRWSGAGWLLKTPSPLSHFLRLPPPPVSQIRSIHKKIHKNKPYQTLHPVKPEQTTAALIPKGPIDHPVIDLFTKEPKGTVQLNREIFGAPLRVDILQRVVVWQLDERRQGTHKAKNRAEVRGGGKKPWKQKGTGRARIGSIRAPHWRGGGRVFPPTPRSHATGLPKKLVAFGMKVALSTKLAQGKLQIVDNLEVPTHKTKELASKLVLPREWGSVLLVENETVNTNLERAAANIRYVDTMPQKGVNVYDLLSRNTLVITKDAVEQLALRVKKSLLGRTGVHLLRHQKKIAEELEESKPDVQATKQ